MVGINVGRRGTKLKDTARNITATKQYVVNIADESLMQKLHQTSGEYPADVSEIEELGLQTVPSEYVKAPRIADAPIHMECVLHQIMEFGRSSQFYVGEIKRFHIRDGLCIDNKIETAKLQPLARVGGPTYAQLHSFVTFKPAHKAIREEGSCAFNCRESRFERPSMARRSVIALLIFLLLSSVVLAAEPVSEFPSRPVRLIVPYLRAVRTTLRPG